MVWGTFGLLEVLLGDFAAALGEADGLAEGGKAVGDAVLADVGILGLPEAGCGIGEALGCRGTLV